MSSDTDPDAALIAAATAAIRARYRPGWHVVGAAVRLHSAEIVTGVHLDANVGRIAVCAEAVALGRAVTEFGSSDIKTIVAVYHDRDGEVRIVSPCGMCREMISDYAPEATVLLDGPTGPCHHTVASLLPEKYER